MRKKYFIFIISISFIIIFTSPAISKYNAGIGIFYSKSYVKENNAISSNSNYYFQNEDESNRNLYGLELFVLKKIYYGRYVDLGIGNHLSYAKLTFNDTMPENLKIEDGSSYSIGFDTKIFIKKIDKYKPYIKLSLASTWYIYKTEYDLSTYGGPIAKFNENLFGLIYKIKIGGEYNIKKNINIYSELGYIKGYTSSKIVEKNTDIIPIGNNYKLNGFDLTVGVLYAFSK